MLEKMSVPRLISLRRENNLYQHHLAKYLGCKQQTYSRYETGELQLPLPFLVKLTYFYDVSTDFILGLTDDRKRPVPRESE